MGSLQILYDTAIRLVGTPYKWGGQFPEDGLDCSAVARILLHTQGLWIGKPGNALELFQCFSQSENHQSSNPSLGALCFYGNDSLSIDHVGVCLSPFVHIEAGGGSSSTTTLQLAIEANAFVRVTPIRHDLNQGIFLPNYPFFSA